MIFINNNKFSFVASFQIPSSSLESLVKNLNKIDFKYLSQEFDNNVLDWIKQKWFYTYEYMTYFETFKEKWSSKEKYYSSLTDRQNTDKEYEHVINVWEKFEMKTVKNYHDLHLKCDVLLLAGVFEKF